MPRIRADLYRVVVKRYVSIRHSVVLIHPVCIKRQVARPLVPIPLEFVFTVNIVIPAVENAVVSFGFGQVLQGVVTDKDLLRLLYLVGQIVEGDRAALFDQKRVYIERTVAEIPILA